MGNSQRDKRTKRLKRLPLVWAWIISSFVIYASIATYLHLTYHLFEEAAASSSDMFMDFPRSKRRTNFVLLSNETKRDTKGEEREMIIPHRLIFTYRDNLLETKTPLRFYTNIQRTIAAYRNVWNNKSNGSDGDGDGDVEVWFLDNAACRTLVQELNPEWKHYFDMETSGALKADICRIAALLKKGGYYLDVDMKTIQPFVLSKNITFSTVWMPNHDGFFQSFCAATRNHPILKRALDIMFLYYQEQENVRSAIANQDLDGPLSAETRKVLNVNVASKEQLQNSAANAASNGNGGNDDITTVSVVSDAYEDLRDSIRSVMSQEEERRLLKTLALRMHRSQSIPSGLVGPTTLLQAYKQEMRDNSHPATASTTSTKRQAYFFLDEINLENNASLYPELSRQDGMGGACNYVVHDPLLSKAYFYSRFVGASRRCYDKNATRRIN